MDGYLKKPSIKKGLLHSLQTGQLPMGPHDGVFVKGWVVVWNFTDPKVQALFRIGYKTVVSVHACLVLFLEKRQLLVQFVAVSFSNPPVLIKHPTSDLQLTVV